MEENAEGRAMRPGLLQCNDPAPEISTEVRATVTGYINAFLAHDTQDFFLAEDGIFLFGNVDETVLADVERSEIQIPHDLPAGSV
ncbi:MAG TPA: hypothetical protein ENI89_08255 [Desulfobulbus sp.]|nr:hypothetical protein [Desulfobulbus sp.]